MTTNENDPFAPHMIAKKIKDDLSAVKNSVVVKNFIAGLDYKSKKTRSVDEAFFQLVVARLEMYAHGWASANMNSVGELFNKNEALDRMESELKSVFISMNTVLNGYIKMMVSTGLVDADTLNELRELELKIMKLQKNGI
jgi:uncharacterized protein (DUF4213/DUF364 family)